MEPPYLPLSQGSPYTSLWVCIEGRGGEEGEVDEAGTRRGEGGGGKEREKKEDGVREDLKGIRKKRRESTFDTRV